MNNYQQMCAESAHIRAMRKTYGECQDGDRFLFCGKINIFNSRDIEFGDIWLPRIEDLLALYKQGDNGLSDFAVLDDLWTFAVNTPPELSMEEMFILMIHAELWDEQWTGDQWK